MALRAAMSRMAAPLRTTLTRAPVAQLPKLPMQPRVCQLTTLSRVPRAEMRVASVLTQPRMEKKAAQPKAVSGLRTMSSWRLRPYAAAGAAGAALPLSSLSAGYSKVGLSLLVLPWKALPMALALAPTVWVLPAAYRMIFQNSMRHTTASVFTVILYLVLSFMPVPCFENLFSELAFYGIALVSTFFMYTFFPEVLLHDFMFMHYLALFTIPLIPLAFAYMPMFAARSYLFL
ncbi:unnamed protein product [Effrenium voratum]|nr:unnamed protein product [Effrenium voratum]|mmetsp:Transcript_87883/g.210020  ORF Transcript_87883/g.210020 Transcript_87883/m.210020 type:complete len:232 (-) Transcript_87883:113-808(-)|eukprot:CAMPEP_0181473956 /NCGR_PEP_ID=MMETSP1110-20121109/40394_1 /TAXON_ID=174948 /ORGANISM="Symbiodinium sp., Strain CCMP421" /LENGTH=231 /DNA_ID=CAMNT_0023599095 /DNA_START=57 /DNA_END=752 /DNA_ORIENTATION=-